MGVVGDLFAGCVGGVSNVSSAPFPLTLFAEMEMLTCDSVWGIAALARKTSVDTEILIYAILDLLVKPVFGLWLLISHRAIAESNIDLGGWWSNGLSAEGRIRIGDEE